MRDSDELDRAGSLEAAIAARSNWPRPTSNVVTWGGGLAESRAGGDIVR